MPKKSSSLGSELYGGAADLGRFYSSYSAIVGTLLAIVCFVIGVVSLQKVDKHTSITQGTVVQIVDNACNEVQQQGQQQQCAYSVQYNKTLQKTMESSQHLAVNEQVAVYFDPSNPQDAELQRTPYKLIGWGAIAFGLLLLGGVWFDYYAAHKYKVYAAAEGVGVGARAVKNLAR